MRTLLLACVFAANFAVGSQAATAVCPASMDPKLGLTLTRLDPYFSVHYMPTKRGLKETRKVSGQAAQDQATTYYLHPLIAGTRESKKGIIKVRYDEDISTLDNLPDIRVWKSVATLNPGYSNENRGSMTVLYLGTQDVKIGGCTYSVWKAKTILDLGAVGVYQFQKWYSPNLGAVIGTLRLDEKGHPVSSVLFDEISEGN